MKAGRSRVLPPARARASRSGVPSGRLRVSGWRTAPFTVRVRWVTGCCRSTARPTLINVCTLLTTTPMASGSAAGGTRRPVASQMVMTSSPAG